MYLIHGPPVFSIPGELARTQGCRAAARSVLSSLRDQLREMARLRRLWMVVGFSLSSFFVTKQWGDMGTFPLLRPCPLHGRHDGSGNPGTR